MQPESLTQSSSSRPGKARLRRRLLVLLMAVVALLGSAAVILSGYVHSPLPPLDGTISVRGLSGPVSVTRDHPGVPTIDSANLRDLFFAQGYITAQGRHLHD